MSNTEQQEIWKTYPEFNFIEVSNLGNVRTKDRYVTDKNGVKRFIKGRVLKQKLCHDGYMDVGFSVNGKIYRRRVHRMALATLCPNPDNLPEVNHIDCDRTNNRLDNLEWCSSEYNIACREKYGAACNHLVYAVDLGTGKVLRFESQSEAARQLGVSVVSVCAVVNGRLNQTGGHWFTEDESEITEEKIREIKAKACFFGGVIAVNPETSEVLWFESQSEAARQLNISVQSVNYVVKGKQNKTHDYWFCYADETAVEKARVKFGDEVAKKVEKLMNEHRN